MLTSTSRKLVGCVQGAKVSVLAAGLDARVSALCLIDPVDNTAWAPLGPGFPSAVQALREFGSKKVSDLQIMCCLEMCAKCSLLGLVHLLPPPCRLWPTLRLSPWPWLAVLLGAIVLPKMPITGDYSTAAEFLPAGLPTDGACPL